MTKLFRLALLASAGLSLATTQALAQPTSSAPSAGWPQSRSDLPAEEDIRFGVLPNGLRYAVMHNDTPTHQGSLRLRIGSGSLEETDTEQGLAHVLEHMAFRGSAHVPNGDMIKILERHGLAFGADTNAETEFTQTVYQLDLPQTDPDSVGVGLMLMRDIAGELTISPQALSTERNVVLSEERLRDTPDYEAYKQRLAFQLPGQRVVDRQPIGLVDVVRNAPASLLRTFYEANYRPDRATLIAVGDFDPAVMEALIKARFSDWAPVGPSTATPDYGQPQARGPGAQLIQRVGVTPSLSIAWVTPYDATPDSVAREKRDIVERLALMVLNQRLVRLAHQPEAPFIAANVSRGNFERSAKIADLQVVFRPAGWRRALEAAVAAQWTALQYGVRQDELDRAVTEFGVQLRNLAAAAPTRRTPALADELVQTVDDDAVDTSPAYDYALYQDTVKGLTAADVDRALRNAFSGTGPRLSLATPDPMGGGQPALAAAFALALAAPVAPPPALQMPKWTHADFGAPGRVAERRVVADLGVTFVRFVNGVRLTVKPTPFHKDEVLVAVRFNHGQEALPTTYDPSTWAANGFVRAGLGDLTYEDVQQVLASKTASVGFSISDEAFNLTGTTRPQDLDTQLQLLAAYMTRPGWRSEAFDQTRAGETVALNSLSATPQGVEARDLAVLEHAGDQRWAVPTPAQLQQQPVLAFKAVMDKALATGPLEVDVVGDVTVDQAVAAVASTFGALPARPADPLRPGEDQVRFAAPSPAPVVRLHEGRGDQAIAYIAWPIGDFLSDPQRARAVNTTMEVLGSRLIDRVRVAEGATYSPVAQADQSQSFAGYGFAYASVETPPARIPGFYAAVSDITADMASKGVSADELERARKPHMEQLRQAQQTNGYWLAMLEHAQTDPRRLQLVRETLPGYEKLTRADVQAMAARYLADSRAWRFEVVPAHPTPAAPPGAVALPVPPVKSRSAPGEPARIPTAPAAPDTPAAPPAKPTSSGGALPSPTGQAG